MKMTEDRLTRLAFVYAENWAEDVADSYANMTTDPAYIDAVAEKAQFRAYRMKRWGPTAAEKLFAKAKPVAIRNIK